MGYSFHAVLPFLAPVPWEGTTGQFLLVVEQVESLLRSADLVGSRIGVRQKTLTAIVHTDWKADPKLKRILKGESVLKRRPARIVDIAVRVEADFEVLRERYQPILNALGSENSVESESLLRLSAEDLCGEVAAAVIPILLAALIAWPGAIQTLPGYYSSGDLTDRRLEGTGILLAHGVVDVPSRFGWPPFTEVSVAKVYQWMLGIPGIHEVFGSGRFGRALAALSYIVSPEHQWQGTLFWGLIGLEALYGAGKEGLLDQIRKKSAAFLGPPTQFKRNWSKMYEVRSRFIHGDLDFPFSGYPWDYSPDFDRFEAEISEATDLAASLLLATLQKLAAENRSTFEFEYFLLEQD